MDLTHTFSFSENSYLKTVDEYSGSKVSAYVTAGHVRLLLLHERKDDDGIKNFFNDVHEMYIKVLLNPFYNVNSPIVSAAFDERGLGAVINSSRAIIFAHQRPEFDKYGDSGWQTAVEEATREIAKTIAQILERGDRSRESIRAMGDVMEMSPLLISASISPTIW